MRNRAKQVKEVKIERPKREKLTRAETLKRVKSFPKRMEKLITTHSKNRFVPPKRVKLTREEIIERMESFPQRREKFIAAVRQSSDRGLHS
jgi:hypothetical protein